MKKSEAEREKYVQRVGTTRRYVEGYLTSPDPLKRKVPRPKMIMQMVVASKGKLSYEGLANYFYIQPAKAWREDKAA